MKFGGKEYDVQVIDAKTVLQLTKFVTKVAREVKEDQEALGGGGFEAFLNILSTTHLYELTGIFLGAPRKEIEANWDVVAFSELLAEVAEHNDLDALIKNLQRVAVSLNL